MKRFNRLLAWLLIAVLAAGGVFFASPESAKAEDKEAVGKVTVFIENTTFSKENGAAWTGSSSAEVEIYADDTMTAVLKRAAAELDKELVINGGYLSEVSGLKGGDAGSFSGFLGIINDWGPDVGFDYVTVKTAGNPGGYIKDGDVLKLMFSVDGGSDVGIGYDSRAILSSLSSARGSLDKKFDSETKEYTLTFPKGTEKAVVNAKAANGYYQVRMYVNDYAPSGKEYDQAKDTFYSSGDMIPFKNGDVLYVGVADQSWPGSATWYQDGEGQWQMAVPESIVYTVNIAVSDEAANVPELDEIYEKSGKALLEATEPAYGSDLAVFTLARAGLIDKTAAVKYYDSVKALVKEKGAKLSEKASTENSKVVLALTALGYDPRDVEGVNLLEPLADMEYVDTGLYSGPVYALLALDSAEYEIPETKSGKQADRDALVNAVLKYQNEDGGFTWGAGGDSDIDTTAMIIPALAPYAEKNEKAKKAVDAALEFLRKVQNEDGSYASWGTVNPETASTVAIALSSLKRDPQADPEFSRNGVGLIENICLFYVGDGQFEHSKDGGANAYASYQSYQALVAYYLGKDGESFFKVKAAEEEKEEQGEQKEQEEQKEEESTTPEKDNTSPETGDSTAPVILAMLALASLGGAVLLQRKEEQ
ncbi:MAG: hypothetical protein J6M24_05805 [Lachnospiraceae bacterium]|nr:hypothetical protein [Lachnospiraceae bacterium]